MRCFSCESTDFKFCEEVFPCPKITWERNILGVCTKPSSVNFPQYGNLEALFHEYDPIFSSNYMKTVTLLANDQKLGYLTAQEFEILGRKPVKLNRQRFNILASKSDVILVPTSWVQETRIICKYLNRLHLLGLTTDTIYLEETSQITENYNKLNFDSGTFYSVVRLILIFGYFPRR